MKKFLFGFVLCLMMAGACFADSPDVAVKADISEAVASNARFYTIRLLPGTDVVQELLAFVEKKGIQAAAIVSSVGSLSEAHLRFANRKEGTLLRGDFETICLSGTLEPGGRHLHLSIADGDGRMWGGHMMKSGSITRTTMEIVIMELTDVVYKREKCPVSTYNELVVYPRETAK